MERTFIHPRTGQPTVMHTANIGQCGGSAFDGCASDAVLLGDTVGCMS
jgi:hypothetical protein